MSDHDLNQMQDYEDQCYQENVDNMSKTYTFYHDAGHGWLQVPREEINQSENDGVEYSNYSYQWDDSVYLEEDCDAEKFLEWQGRDHNIIIVDRYTDSYSFIRECDSYQSEGI